jgi:hypothetical protein
MSIVAYSLCCFYLRNYVYCCLQLVLLLPKKLSIVAHSLCCFYLMKSADTFPTTRVFMFPIVFIFISLTIALLSLWQQKLSPGRLGLVVCVIHRNIRMFEKKCWHAKDEMRHVGIPPQWFARTHQEPVTCSSLCHYNRVHTSNHGQSTLRSRIATESLNCSVVLRNFALSLKKETRVFQWKIKNILFLHACDGASSKIDVIGHCVIFKSNVRAERNLWGEAN